MKKKLSVIAATILVASVVIIAQNPPPAAGGQRGAQATPQPMGFFITSAGPGNGANLGGLEGADRHCQALAQAAGAGNRTWHAYLSATASGSQPAVNARDRIGSGPWYNQKGQIIAQNVADLHGDVNRDRNQINREFALTEKGEMVNGRIPPPAPPGSPPNMHDILTGSDSQGRALTGSPANTTCSNWTSSESNSAPRGQPSTASAMLGHHDRTGGNNTSWNAAHGSQGCSQANLVATGGNGFFYCFAIN